MGTSVSVRGKTCTAHMFILKCLKAGCSKEQIRELCKQFEITNFTQTWAWSYTWWEENKKKVA